MKKKRNKYNVLLLSMYNKQSYKKNWSNSDVGDTRVVG